jgi:NAD(P)-dependent dehydrogenase (short-subunit alcohol dehydrogenase family)
MRRILVTGANKGIGLAIAKAILEEHEGTFLYLGSRDRARGEAAAKDLGHADRVKVVEIDVASDASVTSAAQQVDGPLYGIVNNAGVGHGSSNLEQMLQTNALGVRRVCETFLSKLEPKGRIVNVTSASGPSYVSETSGDEKKLLLDPKGTWEALAAYVEESISTSRASGGAAYGLSKAVANAYTVLLAREHPELRINACTPGFIETDMTKAYVESQNKSAADLGMKPPSAGARAPMFLLFGEPEGNGRFYGSDSQRSPLDRYRSPGSAPYTGD